MQGLTLARQNLYHLSHASSPVAFSFLSRVLCFCLVGLGPDLPTSAC
jgi:hypothetical protein